MNETLGNFEKLK